MSILLALLAGCAQAPPRPETVVMVVLDTTRRDQMGVFGGREGSTPNFDGLAQEGVLFGKARSHSPWTLPSHATLFTGLEPAEHGCNNATLAFDGRVPLLAEEYRDAGYLTGGFSNNPWVSEDTGLSRGFEVFVNVFGRSSSAHMSFTRFVDPVGSGLSDAGAARTVGAVGRWLDTSAGRPVFLFVNLIEPHLPYDPPSGWRSRYHDAPVEIGAVHAFQKEWTGDAHHGVLTDTEKNEALRLYGEEIAYVDHELGALVDTLRQHGRLDTALLAVMADHGEAFGEHRREGVDLVDHHLSLYEEVLRVPLVVHWAPWFAGGARRDDPVALSDVHQLFTWALHGGPQPGIFDEFPRNRTVRADYYAPRTREAILNGYIGGSTDAAERLAHQGLRAVLRGDDKLLVPDGGAPMLFDLAADPDEQVDIAGEHPDTVSTLVGLLPPEHPVDAPEASPPQVEALRALGYVE